MAPWKIEEASVKVEMTYLVIAYSQIPVSGRYRIRMKVTPGVLKVARLMIISSKRRRLPGEGADHSWHYEKEGMWDSGKQGYDGRN